MFRPTQPTEDERESSSATGSDDAFSRNASAGRRLPRGNSSFLRGRSLAKHRSSISIVDHVAEVLQKSMLHNEVMAPRPTVRKRSTLKSVDRSPLGHSGVQWKLPRTTEANRPAMPSERRPSTSMVDSIMFSTTSLPPPPPPAPPTVTAPVTTITDPSVVRARALKQQKWQHDLHLAELQEQKSRAEAAASRKLFIEQQYKIQRACTWWAIAVLCRKSESFSAALSAHRTVKKTRELLIPKVLVGLRRSLRRARQRLHASDFPTPTIESIRRDKVFALYSDAHLGWMVAHLHLRHYFKNETIIFVGLEEQEAFILASGTADVMLGQMLVFTLRPGMTFGTVGMLTGEPRSATIVARSPLFAWVISRSDFDAFASAGDGQVLAAMTTINELRQRNLRAVYQSLLEPMSLTTRFTTFANLSMDGAEVLLRKGAPKVVRNGEVLVLPSNPGHGFIFRGRVRLWLPDTQLPLLYAPQSHTSDPAPPTHFASPGALAEAMALLIQPMSRSGAEDVESAIKNAAESFFRSVREGNPPDEMQMVSTTKDHRRFGGAFHTKVAEFDAPLLLNVPAAVGVEAQKTSWFCVDVPSGCDGIMWTQTLLNRNVDVATIRQNALNLRVPFFPDVSTADVINMLFPGSLSFDFLSRMSRPNRLPPGPMKKWVFPSNHPLTFSVAESEVLLVLRGSIVTDVTTGNVGIVSQSTSASDDQQSSDDEVHQPFVWPGIHFAFFGSVTVHAKTVSRTDVIRLCRADLIAWMLRDLQEGHLSTLVFVLTACFIDRTGRRPCWTSEGLQLSHLQFPASKLRAIKTMATAAVAPHALMPLHEGTHVSRIERPPRPGEFEGRVMATESNAPPKGVGGADTDAPQQQRRCADSAAMKRERLEHARRVAASKQAMSTWQRTMNPDRAPFWRRQHDATASPPTSSSVRHPQVTGLPEVDALVKRHPMDSSSSSSEASVEDVVSVSEHRSVDARGAPTAQRVAKLAFSLRDAAHQRQTHGVPATYWAWHVDQFQNTVPSTALSGDRHSRHAAQLAQRPTSSRPLHASNASGHAMTNQAARIVQAIERLPRPTVPRVPHSHNSTRLTALSSMDREAVKCQLSLELQLAASSSSILK